MKLNRKQRLHLAALMTRFEYVTQARPGRPAEPDYVPGEAQALAWVISVLSGTETPPEVRLELIEHRVRSLQVALGRIEKRHREEDEDEEDVITT